MLEVIFGILSVLGDLLAPTKSVKVFYGVVVLMALVVLIAAVTKASCRYRQRRIIIACDCTGHASMNSLGLRLGPGTSLMN